ncbi:hypothetical protein M1384_03890 [Candidatus Parvarchaeota archaeon]|jgi:hypothetical protein|nr:hypothetical protein [Candidatus Parvarchaeota archaeon]
MSENRPDNYSPGKCNIGPKEIRKRYIGGLAGFVVFVILAIFLSIFKVNYLFFILLAFPLFLGFIGFYQGYKRFCVANAINGVYLISHTKKGSVKNKALHLVDLKEAGVLITYSLISTAVLTTIMILIAYYGVI